ncbi:kelch repeat-containing protein [Streptomyces sp. NPDC058525]|uniref:Kelch repeat-containing protein n=1 Tax=Streptomyces sp. NPDC058525 TaxID=3346538 RepID=UPI00365865AF
MSHTRPRGWRRLAVLAMAPLLALSATAATAQGVWVTAPPLPTARTGVTGAAADCPDGLRGTCVYAVGGGGGDILTAYSPSVGTWVTLPPVKTPRVGQTTTTAPCPEGVRGDCVYTLGGLFALALLNTVEAYSVETNAWLTVRSLTSPRSNAASATAPCPHDLGLRGTCVYIFGGNDENGPVTTVEAYSPATNTWATLAPLQTARFNHAGTAAPCPGGLGLKGTCVYAIGGATTGTPELASVEVYSPILNAWQYIPDMPTARTEASAATAPCPDGMSDGCVYVLGGLNGTTGLTTAEAYTPVSNAWVTLPSMPTVHRQFGAAAAPCPKNTKQDCVYAFGGLDAAGVPTATTEAFTIERAKGGSKPEPKPTAKPTAQPTAKPSEPSAHPHPKPSTHPKPSAHPKPSTQPRPPVDDPFEDTPLATSPRTGADPTS